MDHLIDVATQDHVFKLSSDGLAAFKEHITKEFNLVDNIIYTIENGYFQIKSENNILKIYANSEKYVTLNKPISKTLKHLFSVEYLVPLGQPITDVTKTIVDDLENNFDEVKNNLNKVRNALDELSPQLKDPAKLDKKAIKLQDLINQQMLKCREYRKSDNYVEAIALNLDTKLKKLQKKLDDYLNSQS